MDVAGAGGASEVFSRTALSHARGCCMATLCAHAVAGLPGEAGRCHVGPFCEASALLEGRAWREDVTRDEAQWAKGLARARPLAAEAARRRQGGGRVRIW